MKRLGWQIKVGVSLVLLSALLYFAHYLLFQDSHHIFIYSVGDLAFVPIEVLLVTLILHELLSSREKRARLEKMNMVVGAFFSQMGTALLTYLSDADPRLEEIKSKLLVGDAWTDRDFKQASASLKKHNFSVDIEEIDLARINDHLSNDRDFLLRLLENPNLLEHEVFTNLLFAIFHLMEELTARGQLDNLPPSDLKHLTGDIDRCYNLLIDQWLDYMSHLKKDYAYLFSLALRTNPFNQNASPIVK